MNKIRAADPYKRRKNFEICRKTFDKRGKIC